MKKPAWVIPSIPLVFVVVSCASPGTRPSDMSVRGHQAAAAQEGSPKVAVEHRAAATKLQSAEDLACAGLTPEERAPGFFGAATVIGVEPLYNDDLAPYLVGAEIALRAGRGDNRPWLERVIACHIARAAALGHDLGVLPNCPFAPRGVKAEIRQVPGEYVITLRTKDGEAAKEVWKRAHHLAQRSRQARTF